MSKQGRFLLDFHSGCQPSLPVNNDDASKPLKNARHERFACELAKGSKITAAYRLCGLKGDRRDASKLGQIPDIQARVAWLKAKAASDTVLSITEKREICAKIARGGEKDADRLNAIKVDNDLAVDGAEAGANKALEIIIRKL